MRTDPWQIIRRRLSREPWQVIKLKYRGKMWDTNMDRRGLALRHVPPGTPPKGLCVGDGCVVEYRVVDNEGGERAWTVDPVRWGGD